jgi:multidrug efflux system outer membrane protein
MKPTSSLALLAALASFTLALRAEPPAPPAAWKSSHPMTKAPASGDNWWRIFDDAQLAQMITEATKNYPGLQAMLSRIDQARAAVTIARASWFPRLDATGSSTRDRFSSNTSFSLPSANTFKTGIEVGYELDLWGRIRGGVNVAKAQEQGATADAQALGLMLSGEVARVYFALRSIDEEKQVLSDTLKLRKEALDLATARVEAGATNELDRVRAEAELAGTEAEIASLTGPRTELENSLALVLGRVASGYNVPVRKLPVTLPTIPKVVPAELVQRRPDVASAMKQMEAAQARIGVAKAAYFPKVMLGASVGLASADTDRYFERDSNEWSIGLRFSVPLFVGGQRKAAVEAATAALKEVTNNYEEKLLTAFKEVESLMATLAAQRTQSEAQQRLQTAADSASKLARQRYTEGVTTYLEVIEADRTALSARRALVQLHGQQLVTTVQLIKALGGGWKAPQ